MLSLTPKRIAQLLSSLLARVTQIERRLLKPSGRQSQRNPPPFVSIRMSARLAPGCHAKGRVVYFDTGENQWKDYGSGEVTVRDSQYLTFALAGQIVTAHRRFAGFRTYQEYGLTNIKAKATENVAPGHLGVFRVMDGETEQTDSEGDVVVCARVLPDDPQVLQNHRRLLSYDRQKKEWFVVSGEELVKFKLLEDLPYCGSAGAILIEYGEDDCDCQTGPEIMVFDTIGAANIEEGDDGVMVARAGSMGWGKKYRCQTTALDNSDPDERCVCPVEGSSSSTAASGSSSSGETPSASSSSSETDVFQGDQYEVVSLYPGCCPEESSSSSECQATCEGPGGKWIWSPSDFDWFPASCECFYVGCESSSSSDVASSTGPCLCLKPDWCGGQFEICTYTSCYDSSIYDQKVPTCPGASTTTLPVECTGGSVSSGSGSCSGECVYFVSPFGTALCSSSCTGIVEDGLCECNAPPVNSVEVGCSFETVPCIFKQGGGGFEPICCSGNCVWYGIPADFCDEESDMTWIEVQRGCAEIPEGQTFTLCSCFRPSYEPDICGFETTPCLGDNPCCPAPEPPGPGCESSCRYEALQIPLGSTNLEWSIAYDPCLSDCPCGRPAREPKDDCDTAPVPCGTGDPPTTPPPEPTTTTLAPPPPVGACCDYPECTENITEIGCAAIGGEWLGEGSTCAECIEEPSIGACCAPNGGCFITAEHVCTPPNIWIGGGFSGCDSDPCPLGACCTEPTEPPFGHCEMTIQSECEGDWYDEYDCEEIRCFGTTTTGACCYGTDQCQAGLTESECDLLSGVFHESADCSVCRECVCGHCFYGATGNILGNTCDPGKLCPPHGGDWAIACCTGFGCSG